MLVSGSILLLAALSTVSAKQLPLTRAAADDLVVDLPGIGSIADGYSQYSGYLDGGDGAMLHYWFIESQNEPSTDPLLLWLNGGPGCSSLDGLLTELGPFTVNSDMTLSDNPYSWNTFANIVYLESPACVGFSYSESGSCGSSDESTALHNYNALQDFFARFPSYLANQFFVTGESFGGIYVPMLSATIVENNDTFPLNFQGFAVGNGISNYDMNDNSLIFFANYHGLLGNDLWADLLTNCCEGGVISETGCMFTQSTDVECEIPVSKAFIIVYNSGLNAYNLYGDCLSSGNRNAATTPAEAHFSHLFRKNSKVGLEARADPPCLNYETETTYLNSEEVKAALHISTEASAWTICSNLVGALYERQYFDMAPFYKTLSDAGVRGLVYNGDTDMACNFIGDQWFVEQLGYPMTESHRHWISGGQVGGFVKRFELLDLLTVRGSGHMVPEDKPEPALDMIRAFVFNTGY